MTLGSRIAVMKDGVLQQIGTPDDIYRRPANTYVAGFIGSPTMNFIAGSASDTGATGQFSFEGGTLELPCPTHGPVILGQRPEHIHLADDAPWRGEVMLVEPTGADTYVVIKTGAGLVTVRTPPSTQVKMGDSVGLSVSANHNNWFDAQTGLRLG
ncbi:MAG: multiple sugar transport system ATP-binding protein [Comamonadaceae bacterium]|nr:MAG: multiple sugar transport system ATP-binding protein [Comamonadaceae bacterium]